MNGFFSVFFHLCILWPLCMTMFLHSQLSGGGICGLCICANVFWSLSIICAVCISAVNMQFLCGHFCMHYISIFIHSFIRFISCDSES